MAKRRQTPPIVESPIRDEFASDFAVQQWEDWVRVIGWAEDVEYAGSEPGDGGGREVRRKAASLIVPRSSLPALIEALQRSTGHEPPKPRHS
jgi:hypothetical protein